MLAHAARFPETWFASSASFSQQLFLAFVPILAQSASHHGADRQVLRHGAGNAPVRDWFKALNKADKVAMGKAVQRVQIGWPVGRPLCGSLGGGLYEVRQDLSDNRTGRVLFCFSGKAEIVLLHAFIKKTRKIPRAEIDLARGRMKGGRP